MKRFHLTEKYVMINFTSLLCDSEIKIITSRTFEYVLAQYMRHLRNHDDQLIASLKGITPKLILEAYKLLILWSYDDVLNQQSHLKDLLSQREVFYRFTEGFYDYWRNLERYGLIMGNRHFTKGHKSRALILESDAFNARILYLYRTIAEQLMRGTYLVYRQLPAGVNASFMIYPHRFSNHQTYEKLQGFHFIQQTLVRPPFIIYSKANKRQGLFMETKTNPLLTMTLNKQDYMVYPMWVGSLLAYVYIHIDYMHHGIALSNLFELASIEDYANRKPNLMMIYGCHHHQTDLHYYKDLEENIYLGIVSLQDQYDYFGYLKKMLLTLHNVYMIDQKKLPIHGSMVNILLKDHREKNVIVIGDSGAGKSETLEALRQVGKPYIRDMRIIFDDMGVLSLDNGKIVASGTETGAFVRLDDLEIGFAYKEIDRAIFLNPDQTNARVVLPVTDYAFIMKSHPIHLVLYANNFEENEKGLIMFDDLNQALKTFKQGRRKAKGTTAEIGLVESFFANPFGPIQQQDQTNALIDQYFKILFDQHVGIGELFTELAIEGKEKSGPLTASSKLLQHLIKP